MAYNCVKKDKASYLLFSVSVYEFLIFLWLCIGTAAFITLNWFPDVLSKSSNRKILQNKEKVIQKQELVFSLKIQMKLKLFLTELFKI